jgi:hypothetical protein
MGKQIWRGLIDTEEKFERIPKNDDILEIKDARIFWNDANGTIMVVASEEWRDYLTGKSDVRPEN